MSIIKTITEGGQIWTHRVRMLKQVLKIGLLISLVGWLLVFIYKIFQINFIVFEGAFYYFKASISLSLGIDEIEVSADFLKKVVREYHAQSNISISSEKVIRYAEPHWNYLIDFVSSYTKKYFQFSFVAFLFVISFFFIRGSFSKRKKHISGKKLSSVWWTVLKQRFKCQASDIKIGRVPLAKNTETQHILVTGGTGSGKTNCFHHILPQIRKKKQKAVVVDTSGIFIQRYFREGKDIILNPFDARSVQWNPWAECVDPLDYEAVAESFIPHSYSEHENYWRVAARSVFSSLLSKSQHSKSTSELTRWILFEPLHNLCNYLQGTKASAHIDISSEKTAGSVRSVASSYLSCLEFMQDTSSSFSIKEWIQKEEGDSWLFLYCKASQRAALKPLLSCWFSLAIQGLLKMEPSLERRLWFILDELPTLNRLKDLEAFLSEGRKYGGCALLALQSPAQLEANYGREITQIIVGNCATKIVFSEQDPEIAEKISKSFGEREIKEYQEGLSYGANDVRDGVNLSLQTKNLPLISATAIQSLEKNEAYIKLPGKVSIVKIKLPIAR